MKKEIRNTLAYLAFMFYEISCRILKVYSIDINNNPRSEFMQNYYLAGSLNFAIRTVLCIIFVDMLIVVNYFLQIELFSFYYYICAIICGISSFYIVYYFLEKDDFFEKKFIDNFKKKKYTVRILRFASVSLVFIILPLIFVLTSLNWG